VQQLKHFTGLSEYKKKLGKFLSVTAVLQVACRGIQLLFSEGGEWREAVCQVFFQLIFILLVEAVRMSDLSHNFQLGGWIQNMLSLFPHTLHSLCTFEKELNSSCADHT
jgi:hypothetical protein